MADLFNKHWRIYHQVLENNYMHHRDFALQIESVFQKTLPAEIPLHILDCGCGDAYYISQQLRGLSLGSYTGLDMSEFALSKAKENTNILNCPTYLKQGYMQELIEREEGKYDIIYCSFSMHHLQDNEKALFIKRCFDLISENGFLIVIDVLRNDGQLREECIEEYISWIDQCWEKIAQEDKALIYDHMRNYDFPTTKSQLIAWCRDTGLMDTFQFHPDSLNSIIIFQKDPVLKNNN